MGRKIGRNELKPGDHIYAWRHEVLFTHHGIYVGDEMVIHLTQSEERSTGIFSSISSHSLSRCPKCGYHSKASGVIRSCLDCFLSGSELYLCEYGVNPAIFVISPGTTSMKESDPADRVLDRAKSLLQNGFGTYDTITNNCESFAVYCKTGSGGGPSGQVYEVVTDVILPGPALLKRFLRRFL